MKESSEDGWWGFLKTLIKVKDEKLLNEFMELFLTIEEKRSLAVRYLIVKKLIEEKETQREIASDLNVSISKITRGSNYLKIISVNLRKFLKRQMG